MDILTNKDILTTKEQLMKKLSLNIKYFENKLENNIKNVDCWKFATDEMYCPIPFFHELNKFKKGKMLKNISREEAIVKENIYSFGFSDNDKIIITQKSNGINSGINQKNYIYNKNNNSIEYFTVRIYMDKKFPNKLISVGILSGINNNIQYDVTVSNDNTNWAATIYEYKKHLINKVYKYAMGWNNQTEYDFEYNNEIINKIKIGNIEWWKK